ncbi:MAG: hypothetical protein ABFD89_26570 [Bryobacteraceae bacterium]
MRTKKEIEEMRERKREEVVEAVVKHACMRITDATPARIEEAAQHAQRAAIQLAVIEWVLGFDGSAMQAATGVSMSKED